MCKVNLELWWVIPASSSWFHLAKFIAIDIYFTGLVTSITVIPSLLYRVNWSGTKSFKIIPIVRPSSSAQHVTSRKYNILFEVES